MAQLVLQRIELASPLLKRLRKFLEDTFQNLSKYFININKISSSYTKLMEEEISTIILS